jgi:hypothetical protein
VPTKMTTAQECAEMRNQLRRGDHVDVLTLLDSYEAVMLQAREDLGPGGHLEDCRTRRDRWKATTQKLHEGRCDCIGRLVRQFDGEGR